MSVGKFSNPVDLALHYLANEKGCATEEAGEVGYNGFYQLIRKPRLTKDDLENILNIYLEGVPEDVQDLINESAGAILKEDNYGFLSNQLFDTVREMKDEWQDILDEIDDYYNEDEDDEDEDDDEDDEDEE